MNRNFHCSDWYRITRTNRCNATISITFFLSAKSAITPERKRIVSQILTFTLFFPPINYVKYMGDELKLNTTRIFTFISLMYN